MAEDYCRSGFAGAAQPVMRYFELLAKITNDAHGISLRDHDALVEAYNVEHLTQLQAYLDEARDLARVEDDPKVAQRVEFLQAGLDVTRIQFELFRMKKRDSKRPAAKREFHALLRRIAQENPLAVNVAIVAHHSEFVGRPGK